MATPIKDILLQVREALGGKSARTFWTDGELRAHLTNGVKDLWKAYLDVHGEHYTKETTEGQVRVVASATELAGVPEDCFRVQLIEPWDTTGNGSMPDLIFKPRKYNSSEFSYGRSLGSMDGTGPYVIYYAMAGEGAPVKAPRIKIAPKLSSNLNVRLVYNPTLTVEDYNPVPGESDFALVAWVIAYARVKERPDRLPDPGWLAVYSTEKQGCLVASTPRQEHEPEYVEGMFESYGR